MTNESKVDRTTILVDSSTPMPYCPVMTGTTAAEGRVITRRLICFMREGMGNSHTMAKVAAAKSVSLVMLTPRINRFRNKEENEELYKVAPM
jgi:hypothetical protein